MKKIAIILLVLIGVIFAMILASCNTFQKQLRTFNNFADAHTDALAVKCVDKFPVIQHDGPITTDSTHKANNIDYQSRVDSISQLADALRSRLNSDTAKANPCADVARFYIPQVINLTAKVNELQKAYKPCKSDTVYKTHTLFQVDSAKVVVWHNLANKYRDSLKQSQTQLSDQKKTTSNWRLVALIAIGLIVLSIVGTILKIMGKL